MEEESKESETMVGPTTPRKDKIGMSPRSPAAHRDSEHNAQMLTDMASMGEEIQALKEQMRNSATEATEEKQELKNQVQKL